MAFGYHEIHAKKIVNHVLDLTNQYTKEAYPDLNRSERKKLEHERLSLINYDSQTMKCFDIIDNAYDMFEQNNYFGLTWLREKVNLLQVMNQSNCNVRDKCWSVVSKELIKYADYYQERS